MRSLKRLITALLALVMILTCAGIPTFAADFSDITDQKVAEAVDKLVGFNIITGYEDGTFRPDNQITRAEFAAIVTRYKGIADSLAADAVTGFADLDSDSSRAWARPYVKAAVDAKIINGFDDGTFRAGEPVTYEQAVKMLVCAAGYEVVAQSELNKTKVTNPDATWSVGYIAAANKHGITKGVITAQITQPASRGVVAVLTSNTIDVPELKENEDGTFEKVEEEETNQTVQEIKGVVSGTYLTGLDAATVDLGQNEIMIGTGEDKQTYELSDEAKKNIKDENRKSYEIEDIIGMNVVAYYDKFDRQITSIAVRNNKVTTIKEQDIRSISGDTVEYGKSGSVSLSGYTKIYNGKYYPEADLAANFKNGQIELIEGGGQKVAKITSYKVHVVNDKSFVNNDEKLYFKDGSPYEFPAATSSKPEVYYNGVKKEVSGNLFNEWTVINLLESKDNSGSWMPGNKINKMYVTSGKKTGKITEGIDEERMVIMDGKEVYLTRSYAESSDRVTEFELNNTYTYYLDYTGQIAAVDKKAVVSSIEYKYGYIIGADEKNVRLILENGTDDTVKMKDKVKLDGKNVDKDAVKAKLISTAKEIYGETGDCYQPVKYYITGSGDTAELVALDTVADSTGVKATTLGSNSDDQLVYNGSEPSVTATKSKVTIGSTPYDFISSTMVIYVPDDPASTGDYSVMKPSAAFADSELRKIEVLGADPDPSVRIKEATLVIMHGSDPTYKFRDDTPYMVVTNVRSGGETIEGYKDGEETLTTLKVSEDKFKTSGTNGVSNSSIEKGDIIRYIENNKKVIAIEMIYDASLNKKLNKDGNGESIELHDSSASGDLSVKYTEAVQVDAKAATLHVTKLVGAGSEDDKLSVENRIKYNLDNAVVCRIEGNNLVAEKLFDNINTSRENPSKVIVISRSSTSLETPFAKVIYIVK